jgi:hypothetical protein
MIWKCIAGVAVFAFLAVASQKATTPGTLNVPGAIFYGTCAGSETTAGQPAIVYQLGQFASDGCSGAPGTPTSGIPLPNSGTLVNLHVVDDATNQGSVITIYVNGNATRLTCTENTSGRCMNTNALIQVKAGDQVAATYTSPTGNESDQGMVMSFGFVGN